MGIVIDKRPTEIVCRLCDGSAVVEDKEIAVVGYAEPPRSGG